MNEKQSQPSSTSFLPQRQAQNFSRCGTCQFHETPSNVCFGVGPTPVLMGVQPPRLTGGKPAFHFENIRPVIGPNERACAHHKTDPVKFAAMVAAAEEEERERVAKAC